MLQAYDQKTLDLPLDEIEEFITGLRRRPEPDRVLVTVMFTDTVGSTEHAAEMGDSRCRDLLNNYYAAVRKELTIFHGREVNTAGDGLLATFDGPNRAIRCTCSVRERLRQLGLEVRTGLHTGECELIVDDIGGIAVHIAARAAATAGPDQVLVSSTVRDIVAGSGPAVRVPGHACAKGCARTIAPVPRSVRWKSAFVPLQAADLLVHFVALLKIPSRAMIARGIPPYLLRQERSRQRSSMQSAVCCRKRGDRLNTSVAPLLKIPPRRNMQ